MPSQDIKKKDEYKSVGPGDAVVRDAVEMKDSDRAELDAAGKAWNAANKLYQQTGEQKYKDAMDSAHADAEAVRSRYNYSGGADGSEWKPVSSGAASASQQSAPTPVASQAPDFTGILDSWMESAKTQQQGAIDYATQQGILELQRAEEDAQAQFDAQQEQTNIEEAKALDNQVLYSEARGDRGGIGQAQYAQIQATAMRNRQSINNARTKLSTDVARQITDLRAQGEFQKADALLQLTQTYLGKLVELQQWGAEYALNVAQFNAQLQQWQSEFDLAAQQWQLEFNYAVSADERALLAQSGMAALAAGMRPSKDQQAAMGYTDAQINAELNAYKLAQTAGVKLQPEDDSGTPGNPGRDIYEVMAWNNVSVDRAFAYLVANGYAAGEAEQIADTYGDLQGELADWINQLKKQQQLEEAEIDEDWVYATFGRMISPEWLADQVSSGRLTQYIAANGKKRFREVPTLGGPGGVLNNPVAGSWKEVALKNG